MYNVTFIAETTRKSVDMSMQSGIIISRITGVTGTTATLSTSQGYQQIGSSVQSATIEGQSMTISGKILDGDTAKKRLLLNVFSAGTKGRLIWENKYFCDVWVRSAPTISQERHSTFVMQLYAPFPYWQQIDESVYTVGQIVGAFSFPVNYATAHKFGVSSGNTTVNAYNDGDVDSAFSLTIRADSTIESPTVTNISTEEYLKINGTLNAGEEITIYRKDGQTRVTKTSAGVTSDAIALLDEDSTLFAVHAGDNLLYLSATSGVTAATVTITFYPAFAGVLADGV